MERAGGLSEEEVNLAVLNYLKQKGYTHALQKFEEEAPVVPLASLAQKIKQDEAASITNYILYHNASRASAPAEYEKSYSLFRDWSQASMNANRAELLSVLYPIFVHLYLDLVEKGFPAEAATFLQKHRAEHKEMQVDIGALAAVSTPAQIQENELSRRFRNQKHVVRICNFSFELMMNFLVEKKHFSILSVINQFLDIRVFTGAPNKQAKQEYRAVTGAKVDQINETEIRWGLLAGYLPNKEPDDAAMSDAPERKRRKLFEGMEFETVDSKIPLPSKNEELQLQKLKELQCAVPMSVNSLPSVCCYTFLNTSHQLNTVEISADSSLVAGGFSDSSIKLWDVNRSHTRNFGTVLKSRDENGVVVETRGDEDYQVLAGHSGPVYGLSFSPENKYLLSSSEDSTVRLWSMETRSNLACYKGHSYPVWDVDFSPLGYYFATASHDRTARIWGTDHIFPLRVLVGHLADVDCVKFHPNCNYVATGSSDKSVRLWDIQKGECVRIFTGHFSSIYSLAFSPDGRMLASGGADGKINVWDIGSGKKMRTLTGHSGPVWSINFSQEGTILASGSGDRSVKIWNTNRTTLMQPPQEDEVQRATKKPEQCAELLRSFGTKKTPVFKVQFTPRNLLLSAGSFTL